MRASIFLAFALAACGVPPELSRRTVDVEGRRAQYAVHGDGSPTVLFESGMGDGLDSWSPVFADVAERTRAFAYDRAGYGGSEASKSPRDADHEVAELRALLATTEVSPPYLLV